MVTNRSLLVVSFFKKRTNPKKGTLMFSLPKLCMLGKVFNFAVANNNELP
jgi:hypothetical protein